VFARCHWSAWRTRAKPREIGAIREWLAGCSHPGPEVSVTAQRIDERTGGTHMGRLVSLAVVLPAVVLTLGGCVATRDWVNELIGKKDAEIDTRFRAVDSAVGDASQGAREARERADAAQGRADAAYGRADGAQSRADAAYTRGDEVDQRLTRLWSNRHKRNVVETINVMFGFDRWDLSDGAQTALLSVVRELRENPALTVDLEGYTDPVGPREYNVTLSQRRVEAVRRYLIQSGAELPRITAIGLGPVSGPGRDEDHGKQRRVTVRLMTPTE
jgi:outer membrane protein OmpA-like peptidoglycan-associated protein